MWIWGSEVVMFGPRQSIEDACSAPPIEDNPGLCLDVVWYFAGIKPDRARFGRGGRGCCISGVVVFGPKRPMKSGQPGRDPLKTIH